MNVSCRHLFGLIAGTLAVPGRRRVPERADAGAGDAGGAVPRPAPPAAAAGSPPAQTWRSSTLCSPAGAWQQPPSPLPEGYTKACAASERIMPP